jgi:16S rRNA (guanine527-N7)-methyltransferase
MRYLEEYTTKLGLSLTTRQLEQFAQYQSLLLDWNQRINLTGARSPHEIQTRHFADSLTCALVTGNLNNKSLIDVGSGAGFPGLPLKIFYPQMKLVLLESVEKKGSFLKEVVAELELEDVSLVVNRAETAGHDIVHRQQYDWAVARAVAHLSPLLEYLLPFCRVGGYALAQKGTRADQELQESQEALQILGGEVSELVLTGVDNKSNAKLIIVEKVRETPEKYPRRAGIPVKRPL